MQSRLLKRTARSLLITGVSVFLIGFVFRLVDAGSLTPPAPPVAGTMNTIEESYDALVGTFDSSTVVQDDDGNALEISKCIIDVVNGGAGCP
jgi:hypothetical protein